MAEEIIAPVAEVAPVAEIVTEPSGLPSDVDSQTSFSFDEADIKDGKFDGRWSNPKEMSDYIKSMEDKHSALNREIADRAKADDIDIENVSVEVRAEQAKTDTLNSIVPDYLANGMVITDEMTAALAEAGVTEETMKLNAYERKDSIDKHSAIVGGQENYDIIMDYHAETMTPEDKAAFNRNVQDPRNSKALLVGLQVLYERASGDVDSTPADRVRGNPTPTTIQGYENKADLLRDKKFADSRKASEADKTKYRARLSITPENVWRN